MKFHKIIFFSRFPRSTVGIHKPSQAKAKLPSQTRGGDDGDGDGDGGDGDGDGGDGDGGDNFSLWSGPPSHTRQQQ